MSFSFNSIIIPSGKKGFIIDDKQIMSGMIIIILMSNIAFDKST